MRWGAKAAIAAAVVIGLVVGDQGSDTSSFADRTTPERGGPVSLDWRDDTRGDVAGAAANDIVTAGITAYTHELRLSAGMAANRTHDVSRQVLFRLYRPGEQRPVYTISLASGSRTQEFTHGQVCLAEMMFDCATPTRTTWSFDSASISADTADLAALPKSFEWQVFTDDDQTARFPATRP